MMIPSMNLAPKRIQKPAYSKAPVALTPSFSFWRKTGLQLTQTQAFSNFIMSSRGKVCPHWTQVSVAAVGAAGAAAGAALISEAATRGPAPLQGFHSVLH